MKSDLTALAATRRATLDSIFIETPRTIEAHKKFDYLISHGKASMTGKLSALLIAPSQSGKSRILHSYALKKNTPELLGQRKMPVLHVTLHAEVTRKGLAHDILLALMALNVETGALRGSEPELWQRAYKYLAAAKVQLLFLDEIHHLKHCTNLKMARSVGDCIKHALIAGPCPIVLSGIEAAELPFRENEQLLQRSIPAIELKPFQASSASDLRIFIDFMAEYLLEVERQCNIPNASTLLTGDIPACILEASGGVLGAACRLIKEAIYVMTMDGRNSIVRDDLIRATDDAFVRGNSGIKNPFVVGLSPLRAA